jgi:hypothetical protein
LHAKRSKSAIYNAVKYGTVSNEKNGSAIEPVQVKNEPAADVVMNNAFELSSQAGAEDEANKPWSLEEEASRLAENNFQLDDFLRVDE